MNKNISAVYCPREVDLYLVPYGEKYLNITQGCKNQCLYCTSPNIIPLEFRNTPYHIIQNSVQKMIDKHGPTEIVLSGYNVTDYDYDGLTLITLCQKILEEFPSVTNIVLTAIDPAYTEINSLIDLINENKRINPVLHLSVQSLSDHVLENMNRKHRYKNIVDIYTHLMTKNRKILTVWDYMVGYFGETLDDVMRSKEQIETFNPSLINFYIYRHQSAMKAAGQDLKDDIKEHYLAFYTQGNVPLNMSSQKESSILFASNHGSQSEDDIDEAEVIGKVLQFEPWEECNTLCHFCFLGVENRFTPDNLKLMALKDIYDKLCDESIYEEYPKISFIGGEFFQGQMSNPEVREWWFKVMHKLNEVVEKGLVKEIWMAATLTIGDQEDLYDTLYIFRDMIMRGKFWVCTSYDTVGRFHTDKMHETWVHHMTNIKYLYPNIRLNSTIILQNDTIQKILRDEFCLNKFMDTYQTSLFFKNPTIMTNDIQDAWREEKKQNQERFPNFFPKRADFMRFLVKMKQEYRDLYKKMFNVQYRADELLRNYNNEQDRMVSNPRNKEAKFEGHKIEDMAKCGHHLQYSSYSDTDDHCLLCDKLAVDKMM